MDTNVVGDMDIEVTRIGPLTEFTPERGRAMSLLADMNIKLGEINDHPVWGAKSGQDRFFTQLEAIRDSLRALHEGLNKAVERATLNLGEHSTDLNQSPATGDHESSTSWPEIVDQHP